MSQRTQRPGEGRDLDSSAFIYNYNMQTRVVTCVESFSGRLDATQSSAQGEPGAGLLLIAGGWEVEDGHVFNLATRIEELVVIGDLVNRDHGSLKRVGINSLVVIIGLDTGFIPLVALLLFALIISECNNAHELRS